MKRDLYVETIATPPHPPIERPHGELSAILTLHFPDVDRQDATSHLEPGASQRSLEVPDPNQERTRAFSKSSSWLMSGLVVLSDLIERGPAV